MHLISQVYTASTCSSALYHAKSFKMLWLSAIAGLMTRGQVHLIRYVIEITVLLWKSLSTIVRITSIYWRTILHHVIGHYIL